MNISDISMGYDTGSLTALGLGRDRDQQKLDMAQARKLGRNTTGTEEDVKAKTREVAEEFVSVFMNQIVKSMRATINENPAFHGDNGEKFFQEMLDTEQSKNLAKGSGYGLTDVIYNQLMASASIRSAADIPQAAPISPMEAPAAGEPLAATPENDLVVNEVK